MSSFVKHVADGTQQLYQVPFPYLSRSHVEVRRNGILMLAPGDYEWQSTSQIRSRIAFPAGSLIEIRRVTPDSSLVTFTNGSVLTEQDLNTAVKQALYRNEELRDELNGYVSDAVVRFGFGGAVAGMTPEELLAATSQTILESALLQDLQERITDIETNAESIIEQTVRLDDFQALVNSIAYVDGLPVGTFSANEKTERVDGDLALQHQLNLIGAKSGDGLSWILDLDTVKVDASESLASRLSSIAATDAANSAAITNEQTARINGDNALATSITGLAATVGDNTAAIAAEQTARANSDSALATSISNLAASVSNDIGEISAAVEDVVNAFAGGDLASASAVQTLQATVNGHTSSLQTLSEVVSGPNGLSAQYMVKLDVNGYVSGFGQYNDGSSAHFYILADRFAVVTPGNSPVVPFSIVGGVCYMQNVVINGALIQNATIGNAQIANLSIGSLKLQDLAVTSAKIADAAITSAKIGVAQIKSANIEDLSVGTLKIANNAVTVPVNATETTPVAGSGAGVDVLAVSVPNNSTLSMQCVGIVSARQGYSSNKLTQWIVYSTDGAFYQDFGVAGAPVDFPTFQFYDVIPAGTTRVYKVQWYGQNSAVALYYRSITVLGAKK